MAKQASVPTRAEARRAGRKVKRAARRTGRHVQRATANPWFERAARLGYVVRGLLYASMGILAMGVAVAAGGDTRDQAGTIDLVGGNLFGRIVLIGVIVALAAYSLWGFIRAVYDPLGRGDGPTGIAARIGFAWSGLNYGALAVFSMGVLVGTMKPNPSDSVQKIVAVVLSHPGGGVIIVVAGCIGIIAGLGQFVDAYRAGFRKDLKRTTMTAPERAVVDSLGRYGMFARGVIFTLVGFFILEAGLHHDAASAHGFAVAFQAIARAPLGRILLAVVALGFIALGMHSLANARWVRMATKR